LLGGYLMLMENIGVEPTRLEGQSTAFCRPLSVPDHTLLYRYSIAELQAAYGRGALSPRDVIDQYLLRIEKLNKDLNVFVDLDFDGIEQALEASEARFAEDAQRPLDGIPIAVTADLAVKGLAHTAGMAAREDLLAHSDCDVVAGLRAAGAIILGTVNIDEAAFGEDTNNPFTGRSLNPHGVTKSSGGIAGGAAAAVAADLCVAVISADRMGSVRASAAYCGVFASMPTAHQVSAVGIWPHSPRFDSIGLLCRSMEDISFLTNVLIAPDLASAMRRSRYLKLERTGGVTCSREVMAVFDGAAKCLPEFPVELSLPHTCLDVAIHLHLLQGRELAAQLVALGGERCALISDALSYCMEPILGCDPAVFEACEGILTETVSALRQQIASNGILMVPTVAETAPLVLQEPDGRLPGSAFPLLANIAGMPSVQLPIGRDAGGMPIGLCLIGPVGGDAMVIAQARMLSDQIRGYAPPYLA
jgi:aspartyl-tRNA(Asn)/glutamyl-tRNA(Gln) amidotransferase subunit A